MLSIGTKIDDLEWPWSAAISANFHGILRYLALWEATTAKRMKIDPYCQRQKCRPMTLVSENIRCMGNWGYSGGSSWRGVKWEWGCRRRQFWRFQWLFFGILTVKASNIIWRYATPCRPVTGCKMNVLEWPWAAIWRQNPFSAITLLQNNASFGAHCTNLNEHR